MYDGKRDKVINKNGVPASESIRPERAVYKTAHQDLPVPVKCGRGDTQDDHILYDVLSMPQYPNTEEITQQTVYAATTGKVLRVNCIEYETDTTFDVKVVDATCVIPQDQIPHATPEPIADNCAKPSGTPEPKQMPDCSIPAPATGPANYCLSVDYSKGVHGP